MKFLHSRQLAEFRGRVGGFIFHHGNLHFRILHRQDFHLADDESAEPASVNRVPIAETDFAAGGLNERHYGVAADAALRVQPNGERGLPVRNARSVKFI